MSTSEEQLKNIQQIQQALEDGFRSLTASIQNVAEEIGEATDNLITFNTISRDITRTIKSISKSNEDLINNQIRLNKGQLESKKIQQQLEQLETKKLISQNRINSLQNELNDALTTGRITASDAAIKQATIANLTAEIARSTQETKTQYENQLEEAKKIEGVMGNLGGIVKGLNKIPILGNLINSEKVLEKMQNTAANTKNTFAVMGIGILEIGKSIGKGLTDPLTILTFFLKTALKADKQITEIAKSLSLTKTEAAGVREQFVSFSTSISDTSITTDRLVESFSKLSKIVGFNVPLSKSLLKEFTTLTKNIGISEESAAGLGKITLATGKDARSVTTEALETAQALQSQNGIQLDNREVLEDIGKVSGQLLANFKANPSAIAAAVTQAKLLGTNLETVKKQGESLLNFESSIQSELEAELLTNRALNLEKARAAALSGDQVTVMKELNSQNIDFNKFSNMNVLAQQSLAQALGLSADELSDQLLKQQMMGKSRAEIVALGGEEAAKRLEALSAQDKFNNTVEKLKDIIGNLVAGPFGQLLEVVSNILSSSTGLYTTLALIGGISLGRTIASLSLMAVQLAAAGVGAITLSSALTLGLGIAAIVAGIAVAMGAFSNANNEATAFATGGIVMSEINNATVGEAGPEAIIPLNSSTGRNILGGNNNGNSELLSAINDMKNIISNQKLNITLQNQNNIERSGTAIREYSYKLS
jgi:hypothetical protein